MTRSAIVAGAGIAGLSTAIALRNAGFDVQVYERAPRLEPMGAAISLWANAMAALDAIGAGDTIRANAAPLTALVLGDGSGERMRIPTIDVHGSGGDAWMPSRSLVQGALYERLGADHVTLGEAVENATQNSDGVAVTLQSGRCERADLLIVADGIWSKSALAVGMRPACHSRYGGVLALTDAIAGSDMASEGDGCEHWHFADQGGERFGLFDLGSGRRYWFYMGDEDRSGEDAPELAALTRRAQDWCPAVLPALEATPSDRLIPFSIHAKPAPRHLGHGRIIVVGDAAHAMEPNLGQGACQALEDAAALQAAAQVVDAPQKLLPLVERLRLARIRRFVSESRRGAWIVHGRSSLRFRIGRSLMTTIPAAVTLKMIRRLHTMPDYSTQAAVLAER